MIFTSYLSSRAPKERKVCIAKYARFWSGARAAKLAPSDPKASDWQAAYLRDLEERFPDGAGLAEYLDDIASRVKDPILCCYEAKPQECHRSVLAQYAREKLGIEIAEWQGPEQGNLF